MLSPGDRAYPASANQKRMFVLHRLFPGGTEYNVPIAVRMRGALDAARLKGALAALVARHASLRTAFEIAGDEVVQRIASEVDVDLPVRSARDDAEVERIRKAFVRPFDLGHAPLLRACLVGLGDTEHVLLLDLHHIVCDGVSADILIDDLGRLYGAQPLTELPVEYKDFALWQRAFAATQEAKAQEQYWLELLGHDRPTSSLPLDFPRKRTPSFAGERVFVHLDQELAGTLRALAATRRVSMYMLLLAAYDVLLSKYTGQEDVLVGTLAAGRRAEQFSGVVGLFVNTLVLRSRPRGELTFAEYLEQVRGECLAAFENQDYQFEDLVERLVPPRDLGRNPLFDTLFTALPYDGKAACHGGVAFSRDELSYDISKFELSLTVMEQRDQGLVLELEYAAALFRRETVERIGAHYLNVLRQISADPRVRLADLELLAADEIRALVARATERPRSVLHAPSVVELFEEQVRKVPSAIAVSFGSERLTYAELGRRARGLAANLRRRGVRRGDRVGLAAAPSIEMVVAVLGVLESGAAYLPVDPEAPVERFRTIAAASGMALLLVRGDASRFEAPGLSTIALGDEAGEPEEGRPGDAPLRPDDTAYVIYTSGSTGTPKGVVVAHRALSNYVTWATKAYIDGEPAAFALHSPLMVDLTVTSLFVPLVSGNRIAIYAGDDALATMRAIVHGDDVQLLKVTPTHLSLLAEALEDGGGASRLRRIVVGGEDLKVGLAATIHAALGGRVEIVNEYGPTEATVGCTVHTYDPAADTDLSVPIGKAIDNTSAFVLDRYRRPVPAGVVGELYVCGACLANGYLNQPLLTDERFVVERLGPARVRMYRTGDLARMRPDGPLEFLGRNDDQVKIRGFRVELGEIEASLLRLPGVKQAAVTRRVDAAGDACLCAYVVGDGALRADELRQALGERLPAHMIPAWFVALERLPVARGGKLDKSALPDPRALDVAQRAYSAPRSRAELALARIWEQILGVERVGTDDDFFALGGQSLKAMLMAARVNRELGTNLALRDVFTHPVLRELASLAGSGDGVASIAIEAVPEREHYPVSSAQKRLFILHQLAPADVQYNAPWAIAIDGPFDEARWERALRALIARHESLRTSFAVIGDEIVQKVHPHVDFAFEHPAATGTLQQEIERFVRPFDLGRAPLMRAAVVRAGSAEASAGATRSGTTLVVDVHHIACDGVSATIMLEDLLALYQGHALEAPAVQYKDYAAWQRAHAGSEAIGEQGAYWARLFEGEVPVLHLPADFPRGAVQSFDGDLVRLHVGRETVARLKAVQRECGATLHMTLLAAYSILLSKYSGQDDVVVGTPVAGRSHASLQRVVGMFVNTLAMRNRPAGGLTFREFLRAVRANALDAYDNQDYPFEELVQRLALERDLSRNPLFDTMLALLDSAGRSFDLEGLRVELIDFDWRISKFDLTLLAAERDGGLELELEYATRLFRRGTIDQLGAHFAHLLEQIGRDPDRTIADLELLTGAQRQTILRDFNRTERPLPPDRGAHELFEEQVRRYPDNVAVVLGETRLSYRELNRRANRIARALVSRGVAREEVVGLAAAPSLEMIAGVLGILKAGGAYLPIDRDCPEDRARAMLDDSRARIVLVAGAQLRDPARDVLDLSDPRLDQGDDSDLHRAAGGGDLAYVIYTSGTTGAPKGVMVEHRSLNNLCAWHNEEFEVTAADRATKYARFSFDASVWEIFPYLQAGAALHVVDESIRLDLPRLNRYLEDHGITIAFLPTPICELFLELDNRSLRVLLTGGDRLRRVRPTRYRLVNNYGPTESAVVTTSGTVHAGQDRIPIGRPISNTRVYLLGHGDQLAPIGVPGELCVAGVGLARAYLSDPAKTAATFVADPFVPGGRMYRTGDLARWLPDGSLEYLGRRDEQVKIRGCRTEPREIEATLLAHAAVRDAAVVAREDGERNKLLCAYVVWHGEPQEAELRAHLSSRLPDYMVPAFLVTLDRIPLKATGKVDLAKLPPPQDDLAAGRPFIAPRTGPERRLSKIWGRVLERERVGVHDNFFEIGGDSLRATIMIARANKEFAASVALSAVFDNPTVAELARRFEGVAQHPSAALRPVESRAHYATTPVQTLLYALCSSFKGVEYNLPMAYELDGELDGARLERALQQLIRRHETLRTSFHLRDGRVVQVVAPSVDFALDVLEECDEAELDEAMRDFIRPFDLARPPLVRAALVPLGRTRHVLLMDVHHLVSDGTSMGILFRELTALYAGQEPPPPAATFKDFAEWLGGHLESDAVRAQERYWSGILADTPPPLVFDTDYPRPAKFSFAGSMLAFEARPEVHAALKALCLREGVTLYMLLFAAYNVLLSKYGRQEELIVAAPTSGRYIADIQDVVGMFVNTHLVRSRPQAGCRFDELLREVKAGVLGALEHQQYHLWRMFLSYSALNRGKSPFSSVFIVQDQAFKAMSMPGLDVRERDPGYRVSKFDFTLGAVEKDGALCFELEYSTDIYKRSTAKRLAGHYLNVLEQIVTDPSRELRHIELMDPAEKQAVLRSSRASRGEPAPRTTALELFARQAKEFPHRLAVAAGDLRLSYGELDRRANRLARHLRGLGAAPGDLVALRLRPSVEMVVAILAVWRAGAAYVPLCPRWPHMRVAAALARSGAKLVLSERDLPAEPGPGAGDGELGIDVDPGSLAYVTDVAGRAVEVEHRGLLERCLWFIERFGVTPADRVAKYADLATSATVFELFPALASGASIHIAPDPPARLDEFLRDNGVTLAWLPAPWCERLALTSGTALRALVTFGHNVRPSSTGAYELVRCSGIAENTEVTACCTVRGDGRGAALGKPLPNTEVYILGHDDGLQPIGITGELCVAGAGLARAEGRLAANPHVPGATMVRTGECARWLPDGTLERTGRAGEVNIDGYRVALAEIEQRLTSHPTLGDAAVVFDDRDPLRQHLTAFVVLEACRPAQPASLVLAIQAHLAQWLPAWMIPDTFLQVGAIPRDPGGHVQYEALPLPEPATLAEAAPPAPVASQVASLVEELLRVPRVAEQDNLFDLGLSSLKAAELTSRIRGAYGVAPEIDQVLATPSVSGVSEALAEALRTDESAIAVRA